MLHGFPYLFILDFQSTVSSLANLFLELVVLLDAFELGYVVQISRHRIRSFAGFAAGECSCRMTQMDVEGLEGLASQ